jgi:hypothetical protein
MSSKYMDKYKKLIKDKKKKSKVKRFVFVGNGEFYEIPDDLSQINNEHKTESFKSILNDFETNKETLRN